jgi:hypothetical protein
MKEDIYQQVRCGLEIISYADKCFEPATLFLISHRLNVEAFVMGISSFSTN